MKLLKRHALVALVAIGISLICLWMLALQQHMTLAELRQAQAAFAVQLETQPVQTTLLYFACFTLLTACCLPGASVLMLIAGASFGIVWGSAVALVASAAGASLTMLVSRYLLRSRIEARYSNRLAEINRGLADTGSFYLVSLRLLPVIPFVLLNLLCGLTRVRPGTFLITSLVGMLPGTVVYVNAGVQLSKLGSMGDMLTPGLVGALLLLGVMSFVMPMATKRALRSKNIAKSADVAPHQHPD